MPTESQGIVVVFSFFKLNRKRLIYSFIISNIILLFSVFRYTLMDDWLVFNCNDTFNRSRPGTKQNV